MVPYFPKRKNKTELKRDPWPEQLHNPLGLTSQPSLMCQDLKPMQKNLFCLSKTAQWSGEARLNLWNVCCNVKTIALETESNKSGVFFFFLKYHVHIFIRLQENLIFFY